MTQIKNRFTRNVMFEEDTSLTKLVEKHKRNLSEVNLSEANLSRANLSRANLSRAYLRGALLLEVDLRKADLSGAYLRGVNLSGADLTEVNLTRADLLGADLKEADLTRANLSGANLTRAYLSEANLTDTKLPDIQIDLPKGEFIAYKKARNNVILTIKVEEDSQRTSTLIGRKCRAKKITVLKAEAIEGDLIENQTIFNNWNISYPFTYEIGKTYICEDYDDDIREECTKGFHFFMTREEAESW
jgi:hypothetical protein